MDKKEKFTPGPWEIQQLPDGEWTIKRPGKEALLSQIAWTCIPGQATFHEEEILANARLIAAAPEMLDILKWCKVAIEEDDPDHHMIATIKNIINKAIGE